MFLAIKGDINNVYKLHTPDFTTIEKYLKNISYSKFRKKNAACDWVGIDVPDDFLRFRDCINKLKELEIVPRNEIIVSFSSIQNIEDDDERNRRFEKNKKSKARRKEKRKLVLQDKLESSFEKNVEKDFDKIYAQKEPSVVKTMSGEFELDRIDMSMQDNARGYFLWYISAGGDKVAFGDFKGKVLKIKENEAILFKRIYVSFDEMCGDVVEGKEDHVWIYDADEFFKMGVEVGDCVKFNALAYAYRRKNGSIDFGLKAPQWIQYIHKYDLPDNDKLKLQSVSWIVCETCLYSEHCYGNCILEQGYKNASIVDLLIKSGVSEQFIKDYIVEHPIHNFSEGNCISIQLRVPNDIKSIVSQWSS